MTVDSAEQRLVASCVGCGSVYAALEVPNGEIQPIGSRNGCASCGGTTFAPLPQFSDGAAKADADRDADADAAATR